MRSMHVIGSAALGGAERFYARLVAALAEVAGHEPIAVTRGASALSQTLQGAFARHCVPMRSGWDLPSLLAIRRLIRRLRPDVVQTYMGRATRLTRVPRKSGALHVARLGGLYRIDGYYRHADAWVGNTLAVCDHLVRAGLPASRIYRIGNFVDVAPLAPASVIEEARRDLDIPDDALVLFALGRFVRKKGFDDLLRAFAALPAQVGERPLILEIAGDGSEREALMRLSRELGVQPRVRWLGWQADPGVFFGLADVLVCPSREEPLGNVILEAWAHGLPVVSTATAGALELIRPGDEGLLVAPCDPAALSGCLAELLAAGPVQWRRLADRGRQALQARHSREAVVQAYLAMYAQLVASGRAAS